MKNAIHRDLKRIERHESQLWFLALALLIVFGLLIAGHYSVARLSETGSQFGLSEQVMSKLVGGLFSLTALFCLYALHTLLLNGKMKSLLAEMSSVAASSMDLHDFLPSVAHKIATTCSVDTCQIALFSDTGPSLSIASAFAVGREQWQPRIGAVFPLDQLPLVNRAVITQQPVVLRYHDLQQLKDGAKESEFLLGGRSDLRSLLVVPMITEERIQGIIILGAAKGFMRARFAASLISKAQALASYAATAIDQAKLKREAIHDPLTNLYNRRHFSVRLKEEIIRADRNEHLTAILLCDIDGFKEINDTYGHQTGDEVLKKVASTIEKSTRGTDLVFRWGGDEIVVILENSSHEGVLIAAERIRNNVRDAVTTPVDVSIGIALYPEHGSNEDELIRMADRALYIAKRGRGVVRIGDADCRLDRQSIKVVFQPIVDLSARRVLGHEALTRDPQGKLNALEFFDKYRAIGQLTELKKLCFASQLHEAHLLGLESVFINADFDVLSQLEPIPKPAGIDVVVELSEREPLHDLQNNLLVAQKWRNQGYKFAIDDFGAGFVSLPFLAMLVPEYVKVDRSTILHAVTSEEFKRFLKSLLPAVRSYAVAGVIAEGIENEAELQIVEEMGISLVQGFMFGRPQKLKGPVSYATLASSFAASCPA